MRLNEVEPLLDKLPVACRRRVLYGETDKMNFVYYGHYLAWFEHGRNEYLRLCGLPYTEVEARGLMLPVVESHAWYTAPAHYDDLVEIRCAVVECTKASAMFLFSITADGRRVAAGYTRHACVDANSRPARLPDWLREAVLAKYDIGI